MAGYLTPREVEIADLCSLGMSNKRIGEELSLGEDSVKQVLLTIYEKLAITQMPKRTNLAIRWNLPVFQLGLRVGGYIKKPFRVEGNK